MLLKTSLTPILRSVYRSSTSKYSNCFEIPSRRNFANDFSSKPAAVAVDSSPQLLLSKRERLKKIQHDEGATIRADLQSLLSTEKFCSCPSTSAARHRVVFSHVMTDIIRMARRYRDPLIMALEIREKGARLFVATDRAHFFHCLTFLRSRRPHLNTWHEIMSGLTKLRLYFDLEYYYETNPDIDCETMLREFRRTVRRTVMDWDGWVSSNEQGVRFVELDASTEKKFSRHMIVHMHESWGPEVGFHSAAELREFINKPILRAVTRDGFFVRPLAAYQDLVPLIDLAACHGKPGQNLRILGSPKFGMDNPFKLVHDSGDPPRIDRQQHESRHEFGFHDPECEECARMFYDSLVTISYWSHPDMSDRDPDRSLIEDGDLWKYLWDMDRSIDRDGVRSLEKSFGVRCAFYFEIEQFARSIDYFDWDIRGLFSMIVECSKRSELYEDFTNEEKMREAIEAFEKIKTILCSEPLPKYFDWDEIFACGGDLLEIFYTPIDEEDESSTIDRSMQDESMEERTAVVKRNNARKRMLEVRRRYFKLMEKSSTTDDEWMKKKKEIIEQKKETKLEQLRRYLAKEREFHKEIRERISIDGEIDDRIRSTLVMALEHSTSIADDFERRIARLGKRFGEFSK